MRWLRGGSLSDALRSHGPYDLESAASLLDQIASALATAHQHHIIHRDLNPRNILLDEDGNAYLADFGIAKDLLGAPSGITQPDALVGTPDYLAPEQARGEPVLPQTDIYSLGVLLYEALSGQHPFAEASPVQRLYSHLNDPLPKLDNLPLGLAEQVNSVIQKATQKNPEHRFTDVQAMTAAFYQALALNPAKPVGNVVESLTPREQEILRFIVEGRSNKEIAANLFVTVATVKWYITQIYQKLGVRSRVQAIVRAEELNLIAGRVQPDVGDAVAHTDAVDRFQPENPYKGLLPFQTADHRDFFGREKLVEKLLGRLAETDDQARFLALVGPSGSGKSSLIKAGLIPALWRGALTGSERWFVAEILPGARPLDELEVALTRAAALPAAHLREHLERDRFGLLRAVNMVLPNDGSELVLVIDQFEEVFTALEDEAVRVHLLDILHVSVTEPRSRVRLIISLRADFYDRPLHYPHFGELVRSRMETILPLSVQGMERAISGPAERVGVSFEDGLVAQIIEEMHYQTGALPLLQYALTELFEHRDGKVLTRAAYEAMGGAVRALATRAESLFEEYPTGSQELIRQMFLRLVTLGDGSEDTRRRARRSELLAIAPDGDVMDDIIDTFAGHRLLLLDHDPISRSPTVEVAHEAILREWARLKGWLEDSRSEIQMHRRFARSAHEWASAEHDSSFLARGTQLEQYENWAHTTQLALTQEERDFLASSLSHRADQHAAEADRQAREARLERRSRRFLWGLVAVFALAAVIAMGLSLVALNQRRNADRNAELSQSLALASAARTALGEGNADQAVALARAANRIASPPALAQRTLYDAALTPGTVRRIRCGESWCWGMAVSPDGRLVATSGDTPVITLWDIATGQEVRQLAGGHSDAVQTITFLPDGKSLLTGAWDDTMVLWDLETGEVVHRLENPAGDVNGIAVSPDARLAATATEGGEVVVWDLNVGQIIHRVVHNADAQVLGVAYSPDGTLIASASEDGTVVVWDARTGERARLLKGHANIVLNVTFSPDGRQILSSAFDNSMILWTAETGEQVRQFVGHTNWVFKAVFSPDGKQILSASRDQSLILWDAATGTRLHTFTGEAGGTLNAAFVPGRPWIVSTHSSGYLRVWEWNDARFVWTVQDPVVGDAITPDDTSFSDGQLLALSDDGRFALSAGLADNAVVLSDLHTGQIVRRFRGLLGRVSALAFSPDGAIVLGGAWDGSLRLWDVETGETVQRLEGHTAGVLDAEFSADGQRIVSSSEDKSLIVWDSLTGDVVWRADGFADAINSAAYSPDGRTIAAAFGTYRYTAGTFTDTSLRLFDAATGHELRHLEGHTGPVTALAFSPDGRTLLSGSTDATLRLWDVATGRELRRYTGHSGAIWDVSVSPDGRYAASGSQDSSVIIWKVDTGDVLRVYVDGAALIVGVRFTPDGSSLLVATGEGRLRLWQLLLGLGDLTAWADTHRYVRDLTCAERAQYHIEPLCMRPCCESLP